MPGRLKYLTCTLCEDFLASKQLGAEILISWPSSFQSWTGLHA